MRITRDFPPDYGRGGGETVDDFIVNYNEDYWPRIYSREFENENGIHESFDNPRNKAGAQLTSEERAKANVYDSSISRYPLNLR